MNETLKIILSLSLSGALLILILNLLRPLFKGRLSKRWQYYIWLVVVARLLLPFAPEINLVGTLFQTIDIGIMQTEFAVPQDSPSPPAWDMPQSDNVINGQGNAQIEPQEPTGSINNTIQNIRSVLRQNLWLGWLMVALILFIRKIAIYQSFVKYIRDGCAEVPDIVPEMELVYFKYEFPNDETTTFTVPKDGLYVLPVKDNSNGKVTHIVGKINYPSY